MLGFLVSAVSSAISMVSSMAGSLGGLASTAMNALKVAGPWLGQIANIVSAIAQLLGIFKKEDDVEEMGAKAMQSDKKPEDFSSNTEYVEHLRNDIKLDREKFDAAGPAERMARTAVGTGIAMKGINEQKGFDVPIEAWVAMGKLGLDETSAKEVDTIIDTFKDGKLEDFAKYVDGKLEGVEKNGEMGDTLADMYKELEPNSSVEEIEDKVMKMQVGDIKPPEGQA
jgi:hypothetical protein